MSSHYLKSNPSIEEMLAELPNVGDMLSSALANLARNPTPDGAEILAARLNGTARLLMQIRSALIARAQSPQAA
jgi:hypothetical protein